MTTFRGGVTVKNWKEVIRLLEQAQEANKKALSTARATERHGSIPEDQLAAEVAAYNDEAYRCHASVKEVLWQTCYVSPRVQSREEMSRCSVTAYLSVHALKLLTGTASALIKGPTTSRMYRTVVFSGKQWREVRTEHLWCLSACLSTSKLLQKLIWASARTCIGSFLRSTTRVCFIGRSDAKVRSGGGLEEEYMKIFSSIPAANHCYLLLQSSPLRILIYLPHYELFSQESIF